VMADDGDSKHLWNADKLLPDYMAKQLRRQSSSYLPLWEPEISHVNNMYIYKSGRIKNAWSYTSTPPYVCMVWCLVKHQGQVHLTLPVEVSLLGLCVEHIVPFCPSNESAE
jgi:hypothetical protein